MGKNYCVHPGMLIKSVLMSIGKTQNWLADKMGVKKVVISELVNGKRSVTPKTAYEFEKITGYKATYLLAQQDEYDLFMLQKQSEKCEMTISMVAEIKDNQQDEVLVLDNKTNAKEYSINCGLFCCNAAA